jgi:hypothetical protein
MTNSEHWRGQPGHILWAFLLTIVLANCPSAYAAKGGKPGRGGGGDTACKITDSTDVAIYTGGGTGASSRLWAEALIDFWKTGARKPGDSALLNTARGTTWSGEASLEYVTLSLAEFNACSNGDFEKLSLFFMPGGSAYEIQDNLGASGKAKLTNFLDKQGNYVGICAGGYYAARGYFWKGDDGAPTDNCKNQFCRYGVEGTFSYDATTGGFTTHEWNGTSYHSNLLAYGPLANVYVEGPVEEIAGPWHADSNPNHPYDSHLIFTDDALKQSLRVIYWGGATENYVYTENSPWGGESADHAHFVRDALNNHDLDFPQDMNLWALKSAQTASGGTIMISSAHLEASLFHSASTFDDGGMTECQQYNNYTFMVRKMNSALTPGFSNVPDYDIDCSNDRIGEVKETATLFPGGLAYENAPRIDAGGGGGGGGGGEGSGNSATGFDNGDLGDFTESGSAKRPWTADSAAACAGSAYGARAGHSGGVDSESFMSIQVPEGATIASYSYSYPSALDRGDDFHVIVNEEVIHSYETGPGESCSTGSVTVNPGDTLQFRCRSGGNGETCAVDEVVFN